MTPALADFSLMLALIVVGRCVPQHPLWATIELAGLWSPRRR
jgi:hypothetical protein